MLRAWVAALALLTGCSPALTAGVDELDVKAAMVYNFARFVEWPAGPARDHFAVCVAGSRPMEQALRRTVENRALNSRPVAVRRIQARSDTRDCDLLFAGSEGLEFLGQVRTAPVLTVGDARGFTGAGGVIGLEVVDSRIRFSVNLDAARAAGLTVSSKLLRLAASVEGGR